MTYLFLQDAPDVAAELTGRFQRTHAFLAGRGLFTLYKRCYDAYYGNTIGGQGVERAGEQGEYASYAVNEFRNILKHIFTMVTANKMNFDALAMNSDIASRNATKVCNAMLEYYFYHQGFEDVVKQCLELSLIFGTSFLEVCWEPNQVLVGKDGDGQAAYKGRPRFKARSPFDVLIEPFKHDFEDQNWCVIREPVNKWDLAALNPSEGEDIEKLPMIQDFQMFTPYFETDKDHVWLYKAYHKPTPAIPNGRYVEFCEGSLVLDDKPKNPYDDLPIIPCIPDKKYGGAFGHTVAFDLLGPQETSTFLNSSILTNQSAFSVQNIVSFKESDVEDEDIPGGLKLLKVRYLEGAPQGGAPFALQLCATPPEVFKYMDSTVAAMERISGINAASRGVASGESSGTAIALQSSAAQAYNSSTEYAYTTLGEKSATKLVLLLQKFLTEDEIIAVSGKTNRYAVSKFKGSDLTSIRQVKIQVGNPLAKTLQGKTEMATQMLQNGLIKNIEQYLEVLDTGNVSHILEEETSEETLVREENDMMADGQPPAMIWLDNHIRHIQAHKTLMGRQDIRQNPDLSNVVLRHIQQHIDQLDLMAQGNPLGLAVALNQPLPLGGSPSQNTVSGAVDSPTSEGVQSTQKDAAAKAGEQGSQSAQSALENGPQSVAASGERRANKVQAEANGEGPKQPAAA